jgi:Protein of unknown function (DUF3180)
MKLERTRISLLTALALLTAALGWSMARLWPHWFLVQMPVPPMNAVTMWLLATTLLIWTLLARKRLQSEIPSNRMPPLVAARTVALAMAGSRVGALVLGFYVGLLVINLQLIRSPDVSQRILIIALVALAALLLTVTAMWLERLCQIKHPPSDGSSTEPA